MTSQWTIDTLHEHIMALLEIRHDQLDRRFQTSETRFAEHLAEVRTETALALTATETAISKSEAQYEKRFDAVNEFRAQLRDQQATLLTRNEYNGAHQALVERIEQIPPQIDSRFVATNARLDAHVKEDEIQHRNLGESINRNALSIEGVRTDQKLYTTTTESNTAHKVIDATIESGVAQGITARQALQEQITANRVQIEKITARSSGLTQGWGYLIGALGTLATVGSLVFVLTKGGSVKTVDLPNCSSVGVGVVCATTK